MQNLLRRLEFQSWYFRQPPWDTGVSPPELLEFIENHEPGRAIDLGCGTGTNVVTLAKSGWKATGVDFAPRAIKLAKRKIQEAGVRAEVIVGDVTNLEGIHGPFNLAFDLGCFHGLLREQRTNYLEELDRILSQHGFWLLYGFLKEDADHAATGLTQAELDRISLRLTLLWRRDGLDNGRTKPSAWFLFQKQ